MVLYIDIQKGGVRWGARPRPGKRKTLPLPASSVHRQVSGREKHLVGLGGEKLFAVQRSAPSVVSILSMSSTSAIECCTAPSTPEPLAEAAASPPDNLRLPVAASSPHPPPAAVAVMDGTRLTAPALPLFPPPRWATVTLPRPCHHRHPGPPLWGGPQPPSIQFSGFRLKPSPNIKNRASGLPRRGLFGVSFDIKLKKVAITSKIMIRVSHRLPPSCCVAASFVAHPTPLCFFSSPQHAPYHPTWSLRAPWRDGFCYLPRRRPRRRHRVASSRRSGVGRAPPPPAPPGLVAVGAVRARPHTHPHRPGCLPHHGRLPAATVIVVIGNVTPPP